MKDQDPPPHPTPGPGMALPVAGVGIWCRLAPIPTRHLGLMKTEAHCAPPTLPPQHTGVALKVPSCQLHCKNKYKLKMRGLILPVENGEEISIPSFFLEHLP